MAVAQRHVICAIRINRSHELYRAIVDEFEVTIFREATMVARTSPQFFEAPLAPRRDPYLVIYGARRG